MALYKDGNPVSGLNSIPRLTLAQYNALNVKPEFWVRTDAPESYKKLSADQVSYDSNNTVKDKIDSFGVVVGQLASTANAWSSYYDLPSGFTGTNSVCIGINLNIQGMWRSGDGITGSGTRCVVEVSDNKFRVFNSNVDVVSVYFRATFYKFA